MKLLMFFVWVAILLFSVGALIASLVNADVKMIRISLGMVVLSALTIWGIVEEDN